MDDVAQIISEYPDNNFIIPSAQNTLNPAIRATEKGAFEYLPKPVYLNELSRAVTDALSKKRDADDGQEQLSDENDGLPLIGRSAAMQEVYRTDRKSTRLNSSH